MSETKAITYTESREAFFVKKLKKAERGLDNLVKYGTDPDACAKSGEEVAFYQDALAALREREERREGCEVCGMHGMPGKTMYVVECTEPHIMIHVSGRYVQMFDEEYPGWVDNFPINYCPMCGRKLWGVNE